MQPPPYSSMTKRDKGKRQEHQICKVLKESHLAMDSLDIFDPGPAKAHRWNRFWYNSLWHYLGAGPERKCNFEFSI